MTSRYFIFWIIFSVCGCTLAQEQEIDPNDLIQKDFNKFSKPIVVSGEAIKTYRETGTTWRYIEYEDILVGYSPSQDTNKIKNLLENNMYNFVNYGNAKNEEKTVTIYITDNIFFTDLLPFYVSSVCGIKLSSSLLTKKKGGLKIENGTEWDACKLLSAAISANELETTRTRENEFLLKNVSNN